VLKETGWIEDFNSLARSGSPHPARQLDSPKYGSARPTRWPVLKK